MADLPLNPAEAAAEKAWSVLRSCLVDEQSFVFEAGAGAGKTYSLVEALKFLTERDGRQLVRSQQQIACITFTNAARDVIIKRTDGHPAIFCETTHAFAWSLIRGFQDEIRKITLRLEAWQERLVEVTNTGTLEVMYALGRRAVEGNTLLLHHDDVFPITIELLKSAKFRTVFASRFPIVLIDEYQDTNAALMAAIGEQFFGQPGSPQFGFFGDHWQKIYGNGCGAIRHAFLRRVEKAANFRSVKVIVDCLNRIRPDLIQHVKDPSALGSVQVFHTNGWRGRRETKNHWQGDLPSNAAREAFSHVRALLADQCGWNFSPSATKILMLTHRALATELGYGSLPSVFRYNDAFTRKADNHIAYFADHLEPAALAFIEKRYGAMFEALGGKAPSITKPEDKTKWSHVMRRLCELRRSGTVGEVIDYMLASHCIPVPDEFARLESELSTFSGLASDMPRKLSELKSLHAVQYTEIIELVRYLGGHSPFETKHGVKGAEFENVFGVFGRGWNEYDFNELLEMMGNPSRIAKRREEFERYRNLFYVVCSRPTTRLALLFTHQLSPDALKETAALFGARVVQDIGTAIQ